MPTKKRVSTRARQTSKEVKHELPAGIKMLHLLSVQEEVMSVAFDPARKMLASGGGMRDGTVTLWDLSSGEPVHTFSGNTGGVYSVAFDPAGRMLASGTDHGIYVWDVSSKKLLHTLAAPEYVAYSVAFDPAGQMLASGAGMRDGTVTLWDLSSGKLIHTFRTQTRKVGDVRLEIPTVTFDPSGKILACGGTDNVLRLWNPYSGKLLDTLEGHNNFVVSVAFDPTGLTLASGSWDNTIKLWDSSSGKLLRTLEGHTAPVDVIAFSAGGQLLASKDQNGKVILWSCNSWEPLAEIPVGRARHGWLPSLAFHPTYPILATSIEIPKARSDRSDSPKANLYIFELDSEILLSKTSKAKARANAIHHTTAKIVLVGDSGVGKTGLGWRLAHREFKEHASTHGQQFWVLDQLGTRRADGTECEAILWDLAGQPDYRLTHALFINDADLALLLFDPTDSRDPLHGVEFWLKQLKATQGAHTSSQHTGPKDNQNICPTILVGGRADRGEARLTQEELDEFCRLRGISGAYLATSAKENVGLDKLLQRMKEQIPWDQKTATVTTITFKRIKDYVLGLKENRRRRNVIVSPQELRARLKKNAKGWEFTDAEMMTAVGHLANYGYVRVLRTSKGEERILLVPELLNNLAASFVLEARRNPKGLGSLEERRLLAGEYQFRELEKLSDEEQNILLDSAALLFLEHNVCFRETDPLSGQSYLVFPELINLKKPSLEGEQPTSDGVSYTVSGAIENVYASLVVLLGYTQTFTRTNQWRGHARYEVGDGLICGFRQDAERDAELDLVLYFGTNVGQPVQTLFQGLFESFLARRNLNVFRFEPVICSNGHSLNRAVVREEIRRGADSAFCSRCGEKVSLPKADEPIQLTQTEHRKVEEQQWFATRRSNFEQAIFQLASYVEDQKLSPPTCFISYAWGDKAQERWVERNLAMDLQKARISVLLDRWENARFGASVMRFIEQIEECDKVIVVGTPAYKQKYKNKETERGFVVAAEGDIMAPRMLGTEAEKESVLPVLLDGDVKKSFPIWLQSRVYADFRNRSDYFTTALDLILSLYGISHGDPAVADLRESLQELEMR